MVPGKMGLLISAMLLCFARSVHAVALGADCSSAACDTPASMVCDPSDDICKVKADGSSTDCTSDNNLCPANAACSTNVCACSAGYTVVSTGLCAVDVSGDCSSNSCAIDLVCETVGGSSTCKVKADGTSTDCTADDAKCPVNAACSTTTCSCSLGYTAVTSGATAGLCVAIIGFTCSVDTDCTTLDANTECSSLACACKLGYKGVAGQTCTAVIDSACENNAACSSVLTNSECVTVYPCTKGQCACSSGYYGTDCLTLGYEKSCSTGGADKCDTTKGLACDSGTTKCACGTNGESYKSEISSCTDKKLLGETCTATGDCEAANSACDTTCKCSSGYTQDGQVCRRPYAGETCSGTCDKVSTAALLSSETSQQTPSCTASKCVCGTNEQVSRKIGSTCYTVCLSTGGGTTAVGQTCANFNDCESKVCAECPGDAGPKCYNAPCSGSTFSGSILVCSIILFSIFF